LKFLRGDKKTSDHFAIDVVRLLIVYADVVKLRNREILHYFHGSSAIPGTVNTPISTAKHSLRIIDGKNNVVDVGVHGPQVAEGFTSIACNRPQSGWWRLVQARVQATIRPGTKKG